ncbi:MAG: hypothetical protein C0425_07145 [Chlorobiaceae bacterium]|nr:hypothetical protein [Chlorobiaceae bacterium]MBA4310099.1 hypothetical protein [Chlorobiaceae bacterium]
MKNFYVITLLYFVLSIQTFGQYTTPNTSRNWNLDSLVQYSNGVVTGVFPNYTINNNVIISVSDQVVIQAGSIVNFSVRAAGIEVNGIFQVNGSASNQILFTSNTQDSLGAYEGIRFNDSSNDSLSFIQFTRIEYANSGLRNVNASPRFENNFLFKCRRSIQLTGSNSLIQNNIIERGFEWGLTATLNSSPRIVNNIFVNNNSQNTSAKNQISIGTQGINSPLIEGNKIHGGMFNRTGGISISALFVGSASESIIRNNEIYENSFGIALAGGDLRVLITNNQIRNNKINPDVLTTGSGININGNNLNRPIIRNNTITGNWWGVTVMNGTTIQAGPEPNLGNIINTDTTDDGRNIIFNNMQGATHYDLFNNCTNDFFAQNNDWKVYDSASIALRIIDKSDSTIRGNIIFMPFIFQTSINENSVQPNNFVLYQNYPNPFNSSTRIEFYLKEKDFVRIEIYNSLGEKIKEFINQELSVGKHSIDFNASQLTSGIYFYRIVTSNFIATRKAIHVK